MAVQVVEFVLMRDCVGKLSILLNLARYLPARFNGGVKLLGMLVFV